MRSQNIIRIVLTLVIFALIVFGLQTMNASTKSLSKKSLESAMYRGIMECYALEGAYPKSLEYLEENYHVIYDHSAFKVDYTVITYNVMPNFTITELN